MASSLARGYIENGHVRYVGENEKKVNASKATEINIAITLTLNTHYF